MISGIKDSWVNNKRNFSDRIIIIKNNNIKIKRMISDVISISVIIFITLFIYYFSIFITISQATGLSSSQLT